MKDHQPAGRCPDHTAEATLERLKEKFMERLSQVPDPNPVKDLLHDITVARLYAKLIEGGKDTYAHLTFKFL